MDAIQIEQLRDFPSKDRGRAQSQARNILCFFYDSCYVERFSVVLEPRSMVMENEVVQETEAPKINCYPNPSGNWMAIEALDAQWKNAEITITDISGRTVQRSALNNRMYIWDVRSIPEGMYIIRVSKNGNVENVKVSIVH